MEDIVRRFKAVALQRDTVPILNYTGNLIATHSYLEPRWGGVVPLEGILAFFSTYGNGIDVGIVQRVEGAAADVVLHDGRRVARDRLLDVAEVATPAHAAAASQALWRLCQTPLMTVEKLAGANAKLLELQNYEQKIRTCFAKTSWWATTQNSSAWPHNWDDLPTAVLPVDRGPRDPLWEAVAKAVGYNRCVAPADPAKKLKRPGETPNPGVLKKWGAILQQLQRLVAVQQQQQQEAAAENAPEQQQEAVEGVQQGQVGPEDAHAPQQQQVVVAGGVQAPQQQQKQQQVAGEGVLAQQEEQEVEGRGQDAQPVPPLQQQQQQQQQQQVGEAVVKPQPPQQQEVAVTGGLQQQQVAVRDGVRQQQRMVGGEEGVQVPAQRVVGTGQLQQLPGKQHEAAGLQARQSSDDQLINNVAPPEDSPAPDEAGLRRGSSSAGGSSSNSSGEYAIGGLRDGKQSRQEELDNGRQKRSKSCGLPPSGLPARAGNAAAGTGGGLGSAAVAVGLASPAAAAVAAAVAQMQTEAGAKLGAAAAGDVAGLQPPDYLVEELRLHVWNAMLGRPDGILLRRVTSATDKIMPPQLMDYVSAECLLDWFTAWGYAITYDATGKCFLTHKPLPGAAQKPSSCPYLFGDVPGSAPPNAAAALVAAAAAAGTLTESIHELLATLLVELGDQPAGVLLARLGNPSDLLPPALAEPLHQHPTIYDALAAWGFTGGTQVYPGPQGLRMTHLHWDGGPFRMPPDTPTDATYAHILNKVAAARWRGYMYQEIPPGPAPRGQQPPKSNQMQTTTPNNDNKQHAPPSAPKADAPAPAAAALQARGAIGPVMSTAQQLALAQCLVAACLASPTKRVRLSVAAEAACQDPYVGQKIKQAYRREGFTFTTWMATLPTVCAYVKVLHTTAEVGLVRHW